MKIGRGVSELWRVENRPLPLTWPMAYTTARTTVQAVITEKIVVTWDWKSACGIIQRLAYRLLHKRKAKCWYYYYYRLLRHTGSTQIHTHKKTDKCKTRETYIYSLQNIKSHRTSNGNIFEYRMFYRVNSIVRAQTIFRAYRALHWFLLRYAKVFGTLLSDWLIFLPKNHFSLIN